MATRNYSSVADETSLDAGVNNSATVIIVASTVGFPVTTPYTLALDYGAPTEELVDVTGVAGTSLTVTRAVDGTSAAAHSSGAKVRHVSSARDFRESNDHINSSSGVHGLTGAVVGTTDTQTLTNKTLTSPTINGAVFGGTLTGTPSFSTEVLFTGGADIRGGPGLLTSAIDIREGSGAAGVILNVYDVSSNLIFEVRPTQVFSNKPFDSQSTSSTSTGNMTAGAGWSTTSFSSIVKGGYVTWNASMTRTGANIVAGATGNITDSVIGTVAASLAPHASYPASPVIISTYTTLASDGACFINPDTGSVTISTLSPTATIATNDVIFLSFTYPIGTL